MASMSASGCGSEVLGAVVGGGGAPARGCPRGGPSGLAARVGMPLGGAGGGRRRVRFLAEGLAVGVGRIARVGPLLIRVGPLGGVGVSDGGGVVVGGCTVGGG